MSRCFSYSLPTAILPLISLLSSFATPSPSNDASGTRRSGQRAFHARFSHRGPPLKIISPEIFGAVIFRMCRADVDFFFFNLAVRCPGAPWLQCD